MSRSHAAAGAIVAALAVLFAQGGAGAQDSDSEWRFSVTPYLWAMSLSGKSEIQGNPIDVDVGFSDLVKNLEGALMLDFSVYRGRVGGFANLAYGKVGVDETRTVGPGEIQTRVSSALTFVDFGIAYQFDPRPLGADSSVLLEPYFGGRYTDISVEATVNSVRESGSLRWTDPIIGLRSKWTIGERWRAQLSGDVGGFGVGSDFAWQLYALGAWRFSIFGDNDAGVVFGYRALGQDYSEGSGATRNAWDVVTHGPLVGLQFTF